MAKSSSSHNRSDGDYSTPQREAAMFYGLYLRGHSLESLRKDIDLPRAVFEKWLKRCEKEPEFRHTIRKIYNYRKTVLAIFDQLVQNTPRNGRTN